MADVVRKDEQRPDERDGDDNRQPAPDRVSNERSQQPDECESDHDSGRILAERNRIEYLAITELVRRPTVPERIVLTAQQVDTGDLHGRL
jgi:hypothetical protein